MSDTIRRGSDVISIFKTPCLSQQKENRCWIMLHVSSGSPTDDVCLSRAPNKTFHLTISDTNDSNHTNLILTKPAISKIANQSQCFDFALHSSLWDLPYSFEEITRSVTALAYGQLINYCDWNGEHMCLLKWFLTKDWREYQRFNSLAKSTSKDSPEKKSISLAPPFACQFRNSNRSC